MTTNERRPIPSAPGYTIDRIGQVYRHEAGRAVRVPSDATGRLKLTVGRSCSVFNRREILGVVWPEEVVVEGTVKTLDEIEAAEVKPPPKPEPVEEVEAEPEPEVKPDPPKRRRRRN